MIAVDPALQRMGVGADLTEHAIAEIAARGADVAVIATSGNPGHAAARALYEKFGFRPTRRVRYHRTRKPSSLRSGRVSPMGVRRRLGRGVALLLPGLRDTPPRSRWARTADPRADSSTGEVAAGLAVLVVGVCLVALRIFSGDPLWFRILAAFAVVVLIASVVQRSAMLARRLRS